MNSTTIIGYGGRAGGAFVAFKYAHRLLPGVHPVVAAVAGWLLAGIILDHATPKA